MCKSLLGGAETHCKTPTKSGTKSCTKSGTQGYKFSGQRILKSYQAIHFLKIEDPEIMPGSMLLLRIEDPEIVPDNIQCTFSGGPEIIPGDILTLDQGS